MALIVTVIAYFVGELLSLRDEMIHSSRRWREGIYCISASFSLHVRVGARSQSGCLSFFFTQYLNSLHLCEESFIFETESTFNYKKMEMPDLLSKLRCIWHWFCLSGPPILGFD